MSREWLEDQLFPRIGRLASDLSVDADFLIVEDGETFRIDDFIRIGEDEIYDTGRTDEDGEPILAVWNETVRVVDKCGHRLIVARGQGTNPVRAAGAGASLTIL